jgi:hypothetical protein
VRLFAGTSTETNRIPLVLFGMQNRTFGPYSATIIGSSFHLWKVCGTPSVGQQAAEKHGSESSDHSIVRQDEEQP